MSTIEIQTAKTDSKPSAIASMAARIDVEPEKLLSTLKNTVFKKASNDELLALVVTSNEYKLNPFLKEIYAFPAKKGGIVPIVGFDGWMKIINRQSNFDGMEVRLSDDGKSATCRIYLKDRKHPVEVTEYYDECYRNTEPWNTMPKRMLRHKAIMQAGRVAFGIGGIHDEDEARDIGMRNVTPAQTRDVPIDPFATSPEAKVVPSGEPDTEDDSEAPCKAELIEQINGKLEAEGIKITRLETYLVKVSALSQTETINGISEERLEKIASDLDRICKNIKKEGGAK